MGKKKSLSKKEPTEIQNLNYKVFQMVGKIKALDDRLRNLISYTEYIANNVDLAVKYTEFVTNILSKNRNTPIFGSSTLKGNDATPTFSEFKVIQRKKDDAEIPF